MKIRSSHLVVVLFTVLVAVVALALLRASRPVPKEANASATDTFLSQVKIIRETGGGSKTRDGRVPSADIKIAKRAQLEFGELSVDMGTIARKGIAEKRVSVKNTGENPVEILEIISSCACTLGKFEHSIASADGKIKTSIQPGEEAGLIVSVDPSLIHGFDSQKSLTVSTNDPIKPQYGINVIAHVDPELSIEPQIIDFGTVQRGEPAEVRVVIRQLMDGPVEISSVQVPNITEGEGKRKITRDSAVSMDLIKRPESEWKTAGRAEWDLIARLSPEAPLGDLQSVYWLVTNLERVDTIDAQIMGKVESFFDVKPQSLGARNVVTPGQKKVAEATVSAGVPIAVSDVSVTGGGLEVEVAPQSAPNQVNIYLNVSPDATAGLKNETVDFTVTAGEKVSKHRMRAHVSIQTERPPAQ